ncbi:MULTISPECIES: hypothetical protein [Acidobacterium]|uniref:Lipoprotein n=1 Tax=Acidobacterium capsulatum (strain ATCC 51196 / DSM 11244 / BCRC 80197 / JCM 7670 / NBRC 15755 / NCIMB 13165 / 161) TaxID=240015 RepID=C1F9U2_ACIC5|nr:MULTISPECIES: hypothetical protein [Acidobacterium]ACO32769.1 hypothetical protein ACP_0318 [Acidobacterium capsulatum ATCC 51196]HCT61685.1 hypothetical protein [Acidobacterium sp.]
MKFHRNIRLPIASACAVLLCLLVLPLAASAQASVVKTQKAGDYTVTLRILPAESFTGMNAQMVRDGGDEPVMEGGPAYPNHHMVAFIKKDGKPVEHARVTIEYRSNPGAEWTKVPVARMHAKGKGRKSTHFGNNVTLQGGKYEVRVTVNGSTALFNVQV